MRKIRKKRRKQQRLIIISIVCFTFIMVCGYAAFSTTLKLTAKGNIKDLKAEVDIKVPTNQLLFWGQADNADNTLNLLKDKSGNNNDGVMNGFDNTANSGFNDDGLIFDGVNDYVNIGLANYDFKNSISLVAYVKLNTIVNRKQHIFGNWDGGGGGFFATNDIIRLEMWNGSEYTYLNSSGISANEYYTIIATYDGSIMKLFIDGQIYSTELEKLTISGVFMALGTNPNSNTNENHGEFANMTLKEAMLYDRALTDDEVKSITDGFKLKYK